MQEVVEKYIQIRDAKARLVEKHKAQLAPLNNLLEEMEGFLLAEFDKLGLDSAGCPAGTAYRSTRTSATVADWDATLAYIREHELWNMLEHRVAKKAVEEFIEANNDIPPGVNISRDITINVRRS